MRQRIRSIKSRMTIALLFIGVTFFTVFSIILFTSNAEVMTDLEQESINSRLKSFIAASDDITDKLHRSLRHIAAESGFQKFLSGENPGYFEESYVNGFPQMSIGSDFFVILDMSGTRIYGSFYDTKAEKELPLPAAFDGIDALSGLLSAENKTVDGFAVMGDYPYLLSARYVPEGDVIVAAGYVFSNGLLSTAADMADVNYSVAPHPGLSPDSMNIVTDVVRSRNKLSVSVNRQDIFSAPVRVTLTYSYDPFGYLQPHLIIYVVIFALVCLVLCLWLFTYVSNRITDPYRQLNKKIDAMVVDTSESLIADDEYNLREVRSLAQSINSMATKVKQIGMIAKESSLSIDSLVKILNNIGSGVFVSDLETDEIILINDKMKKDLGFSGDAEGMRCWELMKNGVTEHCKDCPVDKLLNNQMDYYESEDFDEKTKKFYKSYDQIIDWQGKKKVHLQSKLDITRYKEIEAIQCNRLMEQKLMSDISSSFVSGKNYDALINDTLAKTGTFLGADIVQIVKQDAGRGEVYFSNTWNSENISYDPMTFTSIQSVSLEIFKELESNDHEYVICNNISKSLKYSSLSETGVQSFFAIPIMLEEGIWGLLTFASADDKRQWSTSDVQISITASNIISSAVARAQVEEELIKMSSITQSSPEYIAYIDTHGEYDFFNSGVVNITGYSYDELMTGGMKLLLAPDIWNRVSQVIIPDILAHDHSEFELPIICKDGTEKTLKFSGFKTSSTDEGLATIATDITERLILEKELLIAKDAAEDSNNAKSNFISRLSHEIRTPMNAIMGMIGIAEATNDPVKQQESFAKVQNAAKQLMIVISDMMDISKIESGRMELSFRTFDYYAMINRIATVVSFAMQEKGQNLFISIGSAVPQYIVSDENRLSQMLTNLLTNATRFTYDGGDILLETDVLNNPEGTCRLEIRVMDSGIGIAPGFLEKLTQPYDETAVNEASGIIGSGIGLSIAKGIAELMGGSIHVESIENAGSAFTITVDVQKGETPLHSFSPIVSWQNLRILVIDDSSEVLKFFDDFGRNACVELICSSGGQEALKILGESDFDIIFIDEAMPAMDGWETAQEIINAGHVSPMLVLMSEQSGSAAAQGICEILKKPLQQSEIIQCINGLLEKYTKPVGLVAHFPSGYFSDKTVLIAEDMEINREIVSEVLKESGINIIWAENGFEAVRRFNEHSDEINMIFMDVSMPVMNGLEATQSIRETDRDIPIVAMTANVLKEDVENCLNAGMTGHIGKPMDIHQVMQVLNRYCG